MSVFICLLQAELLPQEEKILTNWKQRSEKKYEIVRALEKAKYFDMSDEKQQKELQTITDAYTINMMLYLKPIDIVKHKDHKRIIINVENVYPNKLGGKFSKYLFAMSKETDFMPQEKEYYIVFRSQMPYEKFGSKGIAKKSEEFIKEIVQLLDGVSS